MSIPIALSFFLSFLLLSKGSQEPIDLIPLLQHDPMSRLQLFNFQFWCIWLHLVGEIGGRADEVCGVDEERWLLENVVRFGDFWCLD